MMGMINTEVLKAGDEGIVRLAHDTMTNSYSIGLRTINNMEWKSISKELYEILVKELKDVKGNRMPKNE